ncbi:hypothetical protein C8R48DRAFT_678991 [Suillus tomentosus]|nr:hypothetical protein C8R48DRAFT_678991 [Suillus tomentosus]
MKLSLVLSALASIVVLVTAYPMEGAIAKRSVMEHAAHSNTRSIKLVYAGPALLQPHTQTACINKRSTGMYGRFLPCAAYKPRTDCFYTNCAKLVQQSTEARRCVEGRTGVPPGQAILSKLCITMSGKKLHGYAWWSLVGISMGILNPRGSWVWVPLGYISKSPGSVQICPDLDNIKFTNHSEVHSARILTNDSEAHSTRVQ